MPHHPDPVETALSQGFFGNRADPTADTEYSVTGAAKPSGVINVPWRSAVLVFPGGVEYLVTVADDGTLTTSANPVLGTVGADVSGGTGGGSQGTVTITDVTVDSADPDNTNTITIHGSGFASADIAYVRLKQNGGSYIAGAVGTPMVVDDNTITVLVQSASYDGTFGMVMDVGLLDSSPVSQATATPLAELVGGYTFPPAGTLDPNAGSMTADTPVTVTDNDDDLSLALEVDILGSGGAVLLSAPVTVVDGNHLTATIPAGNTGTGVTADTPYDVQIVLSTPKGGNNYLVYNGAFRFTA